MDVNPKQLLARLGADITRVRVEPLPHNRWLSPGVWRVSGPAFTAVLKYASAARDKGATRWDGHWTAGDGDPKRWNYWAREGLFYNHGIRETCPGGGLHAPTCLAVLVEDDEALLLLEWIDGKPAETWALNGYGCAAEAIGRAQAPFTAGGSLPDLPWLSRSFLREYSSDKPVEWSLLDDDDAWDNPVVNDYIPRGLRDAATFLHRHADELYLISEALPRTLCHLDFWTKNLFQTPDGRTVAIDWSFVGDGAVGEDVGNLILDAAFDHFVPADQLPRLEHIVSEGYLRGLRSGGWSEDPRLVQLGIWSSAVKYDWLTALTLERVRAPRQFRYGGHDEIDPSYRFRERGLALLFNAAWARQALELAEQVGL